LALWAPGLGRGAASRQKGRGGVPPPDDRAGYRRGDQRPGAGRYLLRHRKGGRPDRRPHPPSRPFRRGDAARRARAVTPGRRGKGPSPEDQTRGAKIVERIRPLSGRAPAKPSAPEPEPPAAPPKPAKIARPARPAGAPNAPPPVTRPPPLAPIEPKL